MCYLRRMPGDDPDNYFNEFYEPSSPAPRPLPRLEWAMPVNPAELGASLTAYHEHLPGISTLRLCHRFGGGPLSTLPQEILDHIIKVLHQSCKEAKMHEWSSPFACFQGRCTKMQHLDLPDVEVEELWDAFFTNQHTCCARHRREENLDSDDYSLEQKREMVADYIEDDDEMMCDTVFDGHTIARDRWLDMLCLCRDKLSTSASPRTFTHLNKLLKSHFGVEVSILHEKISGSLVRFLPDTYSPSANFNYTSCFLVLCRSDNDKVLPRSRLELHENQNFLKRDNHLAYYRKIDTAHANLSEEQKTYFARALRVLDIRPYFHLTELEPCLTPANNDKAFWKICDAPITNCPKISSASLATKKLRLEQYLDHKNAELAEQAWPQLMMIAASDIVSPVG